MNIDKNEQQDFINDFIAAKAILDGHFILSSGLHSDKYMQCALLLKNPKIAEKTCQALAKKIINQFGENAFDLVLSPAMGGVVVGYELARQLGLEAIFCERVNGKFELRRGFEIKKDSRLLIVEDVITTGKSSLETFTLARNFNANIVAEACLVDRSQDKNLDSTLGVPVISLINLEIRTFDANNIPSDLRNVPAIKPGSRFINS
jgi:orotate phosphoribosyltransferase